MANEYLIPFGVDPGPFFKGINEMSAGTDRLKANAGEAAKELTQGFKNAAEAGDKLVKVVDTDTKQLTKLKDEAKRVGKEVGEALSGKNVGSDFESRMEKFTGLMSGFASKAGGKVNFDVDTAKLEHFQQLIESGADDFQVLNQVVEHTKQVLATLDPNSEEFAELAQQVELADGFLKEMADVSGNVEVKGKSLRTQLRQMKEELAAMELAGKGNTEEFIKLSVAAGELEDQMGDVSSRVRVLASDTKHIDAAVGAVTALAGGFAAAQGAVALFGDENEAVNKVIEKVTGAMALLQGVQAVAQALNKDSAISVLLFSRAQATAAVTTEALAVAEGSEAAASVAATTATEGLTAALLANPITAVLVAIAALVAGLVAFTSSSDDAKKATDDFNRSLEENANLLSMDEASLKRRADVQVAEAKRAGAAESSIMKIEGNSLIERLQLREDYLNKLRAQYNDENNRRQLEPEALKKLGADIAKAENDAADLRTQIQIKRLDVAKKIDDEDKTAQQKRKQAQDKALAEEKKTAEERKRLVDQQVKFAKDLRDAMAAGIGNQYEKERAQALANMQDRIEALNNEKALSKKAVEERDAVIIQLRKNYGEEVKQINAKELADRSNLEFQAQKTVADLQKDGLSKEIDLLLLGFEERRRQIREQYKNEAELRETLIDRVNRAELEAETKARNEGARQAQKDNEENQVLQVETAAKYLSNLPKVEEAKNIAVLQVRLKYAEKYLKLLRDQGEDENSTVVLQAKKQVQALSKTLADSTKEMDTKNKTFSLSKLLFGDLSAGDSDAVDKAAAAAMDSVRQITDFVVDQYQRQIDKKKQIIDADNKAVDELEKALDKEKDLRDQGLANNVDAIQQELDEKKSIRDQDLKDQEELVAKQAAARRAQLVIDTVAQASNLITAASEIFAALAGIPFVGVPLAITTIGLMSAAFVAAKVKAFQMVGEGQKFAEGGEIEAPSHAVGGQKYRSIDGRGKVIELEGGEYVVNKMATQKHYELIEAINNDDIRGMSDSALKGLLSGMGIHFEAEKTKEVVSIAREREQLKTTVVINDNKEELKSIERNTAFLAEKEKNKVERWEDSEFEYIKQGNKTTKVKK